MVKIALKFVGLKIAFLDNDGNSMPDQVDTPRPPSAKSRSNADFSNHTWVPVPDDGIVTHVLLIP